MFSQESLNQGIINYWAQKLTKTRSGKIMRRILRQIANKNYENLGDTSTLTDPTVIQKLIENK